MRVRVPPPPPYGLVVQRLVQRTHNPLIKVRVFAGPPAYIFAAVAQLAEQGTFNPKVVGSKPTGSTLKRKEKK